ncbi:GNAT family N-acetyltransferase [Actinomycetaceae bacterium L2_0104]
MENRARVAIREANVLDADALAKLHGEVWRSSFADVVPEEVLAGREERSRERFSAVLAGHVPATVWIAESEGEVCGFAQAEAEGPTAVRSLKLTALYVRPELQRRGIGGSLLLRAIGDAPAYLWTRPGPAQRFYEKHGFVVDGAESEMVGIPIVRMVR